AGGYLGEEGGPPLDRQPEPPPGEGCPPRVGVVDHQAAGAGENLGQPAPDGGAGRGGGPPENPPRGGTQEAAAVWVDGRPPPPGRGPTRGWRGGWRRAPSACSHPGSRAPPPPRGTSGRGSSG